MDRRKLITAAALGSAATLIPAGVANAHPGGPAGGADASALKRLMTRYLARELDDARAARLTTSVTPTADQAPFGVPGASRT